MKRRNFLQKSGLIAGGVLLQNPLAKAIEADDIKLKIAVIGCGDRGTGLIRTMQSLPNLFRVTAICDVLDFRLDNAKRFLETVSTKVTQIISNF